MKRTFYTILGIAGAAAAIYAIIGMNSTSGRLIPRIVADYIARAFPEAEIVRIEKAGTGYEAELSDGRTLRFNGDGEFVCYI